MFLLFLKRITRDEHKEISSLIGNNYRIWKQLLYRTKVCNELLNDVFTNIYKLNPDSAKSN